MDIVDLKKLAGITETPVYIPYTGSNISVTGTEKRKLERDLGLKPGDPDWFKLWFSLPYLTGPLAFRGRSK